MSGTPINPAFSSPVFDAQILRGVAYGLYNAPSRYIADLVMPELKFGGDLFDGSNILNAKALRGRILTVSGLALMGDPDARDEMGVGEETPVDAGLDFQEVEYMVHEYARSAFVSDFERAQAAGASAVDLIKAKTMRVIETLKAQKEARVAALLTTAANFSNSTTIVNAADKWNSTGNPSANIGVAVDAVAQYGKQPNVCILGAAAYQAIRNNNAFLEFRETNTDRTTFNQDRVAAALKANFGFDHVFFGMATRAVAGSTTPSAIWGNDVFVGYLPIDSGIGSLQPDGMGMAIDSSAAYRVTGKQFGAIETPNFAKRGVDITLSYWEALGILQPEMGYVIADVT